MTTATTYRVDDVVTICDEHSSYYRKTGTVTRVLTLHCGEIVYEIAVSCSEYLPTVSWIFKANQFYMVTK